MTCIICKHDDITPGMVTVTLERGGTTLDFKGVPAQVCENCGEAYPQRGGRMSHTPALPFEKSARLAAINHQEAFGKVRA